MIINSLSPTTASTITPFNPLGRQPVGEEDKETKNSSLKAVEESAQLSRNIFRQDDKNDLVEPIQEEDQENDTRQEHDRRDKETEQSKNEQKETREEKRIETEEQAEIRELARRDREIRDHERAHAAVGGQYAGAPSYQYTRGPDGISYAVAGEVNIKTGVTNSDPQQTINKAMQIRRAALAPADPSPQDRRVAANAAQMEIDARQSLLALNREEAEEKETAEKETEKAKKIQQEQESTSTPIKGDSRTDSLEASQQTNKETNRRIIDVNSNYLTLLNKTARLGSIVSDAV